MPSNQTGIQFHSQYINVNDRHNLQFGLNNVNKTYRIDSLAGTKTTTATQSDACPTSNFQAILIGIVVSAVSGTTPSLTVNFQTSATFGGSYTTIASSAAITAPGTYYFFAQGQFFKLNLAISGTTPSFTIAGIGFVPFYIDQVRS
jgi:hypothetical protein